MRATNRLLYKYQLSTIHYQLSTVNYQLSTVNYQLSTANMTEIAIAGAGVVGATIAYELSRVPQLNITLLDRNTTPSGATTAALGILMGIISRKTKGRAWQLRQASMKRYDSLIRELEALTGIEIPFNGQGILQLLFTTEDLPKWERLVEMRRSQGWELQIWQPEQVRDYCPHVAWDKIAAAIYSPGDRQVNPTILTQALITAAQQNGVNCQFGVNLEKISSQCHSQGEKIVLETHNGKWNLDWLVVAAGLGSTALTASLNEKIDIRPVLGQALELKLEDTLGNEDFQPVISAEDVHLLPLGKGSYWLGATVEFPTVEGEITPTPEMLEEVSKKAIAFCPALEKATIVRSWSGLRPRPEGRSAPVIGPLPGWTRVLLATGHYRNGILLAPATAAVIKELVVGC